VATELSHKKSHVHYVLSAHHRTATGKPAIAIHLSRTEAKKLFSQLGRILHRSKRGVRSYHCAVLLHARAWTRLTVQTISSHRRECAENAAHGTWVTQ
jgi:hypothetical protein